MTSRTIKIFGYARYAAWICVGIIIVLSLVPGDERPHTGFDGKWEHIAAYAGTGAIAAIGYQLRSQRLGFWSAVAGLSFVMEFLQQFVPGRGPALLDAIASSSGLTAGLLAGAVFVRMVLKNRSNLI